MATKVHNLESSESLQPKFSPVSIRSSQPISRDNQHQRIRIFAALCRAPSLIGTRFCLDLPKPNLHAAV